MKYRIGDTICIKANGKIYSNLFVSGSVKSARVYFVRLNYVSWKERWNPNKQLLAICTSMHNEKFLFSSKQVLVERVVKNKVMTL
jgi:hypothetical protein